MTGYDEATEWLQTNAPGWRVVDVASELRRDLVAGYPRRDVVTVTLRAPDGASVRGAGMTIRDATECAVGGLVSNP